MIYNLKRTVNDVLKIISLGVLASINGMSGDAFAMDDEHGFGGASGGRSVLDGVRSVQGEIDPDAALAAAIAASLESVQFVDYQDDPFSSGRGEDFPAAAAARPQGREEDELERAIAASRASFEEELRYALELSRQDALGYGQAAAGDDFPEVYRRAPYDFGAAAADSEDDAYAGAAAAAAAPVLREAEPQINFSDLPVREWTAVEINGENFTREVSKHIALAYDSLKRRTIYGDIENLRAELESWQHLQQQGVGQGIQAKIDGISQEIADLEGIMASEPTLQAWTESVLGEVGRLVRGKNKGPRVVAEKIQKMITDLFYE